MSNFNKEPTKAQDIIEQSLWLNKYIEINNKTLYWRSWINSGILHINVITQDEIQFKYNLTNTYLAIIQIQESIPKKWLKILKQNVYAVPILNIKNNSY